MLTCRCVGKRQFCINHHPSKTRGFLQIAGRPPQANSALAVAVPLFSLRVRVFSRSFSADSGPEEDDDASLQKAGPAVPKDVLGARNPARQSTSPQTPPSHTHTHTEANQVLCE
jgi:hypothetical protein